jgi:hypothetical protein
VRLVGAALALGTLAGCGGSASSPSTGGGSATSEGKYAIEREAQSRGIKGESPTTEASTSLRISAGDCARLAAAAEGRLGRSVGGDPTPTPPLSKCRLAGRGVAINVFLDSGFAAHQRYMNRIEETQQFGAPDPRKVPHPVAGVGDKGAYNQNANWVPAYGSLFAVRGNRWLTVDYSVTGKGNRESRQEAADLARLAFRLSAE